MMNIMGRLDYEELAGRRLGQELATLRSVYRSGTRARIACLGIFAVCGLLIAVSIGIDIVRYVTGASLTMAFSLGRDGSITELYGYLLAAVVVVMLGAAFLSARLRSFVFISTLFAFVLVDDALRYHETFGWILSRSLTIPAVGGMRSEDLGELLAWLIAALILVPVLAWCLWGRASGDMGVYLVYGTIMVVLGFFAVGLDIIHSILGGPKELGHALGWIEDGGELVMLCCAAASAILYQQLVGLHPQLHSEGSG